MALFSEDDQVEEDRDSIHDPHALHDEVEVSYIAKDRARRKLLESFSQHIERLQKIRDTQQLVFPKLLDNGKAYVKLLAAYVQKPGDKDDMGGSENSEEDNKKKMERINRLWKQISPEVEGLEKSLERAMEKDQALRREQLAIAAICRTISAAT